MTSMESILLVGGPLDGARFAFPCAPAAILATFCNDCAPCRARGGFGVLPTGAPPAGIGARMDAWARQNGYVEYKRDQLLPDGAWQYLYGETPVSFDGLQALTQRGRDREVVAA